MSAIGYFMLIFGFLMTAQGTTWTALGLMAAGVFLIHWSYKLGKK
jgi:membrane-bound ClpP family serine protease